MRLVSLKDITDEDLLNILREFKYYAIKGDFNDDTDLLAYINRLRTTNK